MVFRIRGPGTIAVWVELKQNEDLLDMIYGNLTSPDLKALAPDTVAVLPLAAVEQHGDHLPVATDTEIVTEIARRTESAMTEKIVLLPTLWAGSSHHHLAFPGTLSISSETYINVLSDLLDSLTASGFRRVFLLNGHGGNKIPYSEALFRKSLQRENLWVAGQNYWHLAEAELAGQDFMATPRLTHACEYETSMMLALGEDHVRMDRACGCRKESFSAWYDSLGWSSTRVVVSEPFEKRSPNGAMGAPDLASAEKGQKLFEIITQVVIEFLEDFRSWPLPA